MSMKKSSRTGDRQTDSLHNFPFFSAFGRRQATEPCRSSVVAAQRHPITRNPIKKTTNQQQRKKSSSKEVTQNDTSSATRAAHRHGRTQFILKPHATTTSKRFTSPPESTLTSFHLAPHTAHLTPHLIIPPTTHLICFTRVGRTLAPSHLTLHTSHCTPQGRQVEASRDQGAETERQRIS